MIASAGATPAGLARAQGVRDMLRCRSGAALIAGSLGTKGAWASRSPRSPASIETRG